jgi:hypothetical protein
LANDKPAYKNDITIDGKKYRFKEHMTALEIKDVLGEHYPKFKTIGFIRHPYGRIVSSYNFYRQGAKGWAWKGREKQRPLTQKIKILFARYCPFYLWSVLYPYKSNIEYFVNEKNETIVDKIGIFENLKEDFSEFFRNLNIEIDKLPHTNRSNHKEEASYFNNRMFRWLINIKIAKDYRFYHLIPNQK